MRRRISPEDYKGQYYDRIRADDILVMGREPCGIAGRFPLDKGIYESLWLLSNETDLGMMIDLRRIPISLPEIERCNLKDLNPYEIPRHDEIYILHPKSEYYLEDMGIIGYMTEDKTCRIKNRDMISYLGS